MRSTSRNRLAALIAAVLTFLSLPAAADIFRVGDYRFFPGEERGTYELSVSVPENSASSAPVIWPKGCTERSRDTQIGGGTARIAFAIACDRPLGSGDIVRTPWSVDGGTFQSSATGATITRALQPDGDTVTLPIGEGTPQTRALPEIATDYTWQGILHILGGWDHLAFVLCLCLLVRGRALLALVTTFTIGHSLSLALAFFEIVRVPVPPVEAVIALSIAFMAREAIRAGQPTGAIDRGTLRRYVAVVAAFGLLHGLGFATVLRELGVAPGERASALLFFNAGVEIGQLLFVGFVTLVMAIATMAGRAAPLRTAALYGAGVIGCFWMIERIAGFTGALA